MPDIGLLVERGQVRKVICAFTAATRASDVLPFTNYYVAGEVESEPVAQGTLGERHSGWRNRFATTLWQTRCPIAGKAAARSRRLRLADSSGACGSPRVVGSTRPCQNLPATWRRCRSASCTRRRAAGSARGKGSACCAMKLGEVMGDCAARQPGDAGLGRGDAAMPRAGSLQGEESAGLCYF